MVREYLQKTVHEMFKGLMEILLVMGILGATLFLALRFGQEQKLCEYPTCQVYAVSSRANELDLGILN